MDWTGVLALVALLTAAGTLLHNWRQSKGQVRRAAFTELIETVDALGKRLADVRAELADTKLELADTKAELRVTQAELEAAQVRLDSAKEANTKLRGRVYELEEANRKLLGEKPSAG